MLCCYCWDTFPVFKSAFLNSSTSSTFTVFKSAFLNSSTSSLLGLGGWAVFVTLKFYVQSFEVW
jgi:hypothetical protein